MPARMEEDDFEDFVDRVDDVEKAIKDLLSGKIDPTDIDDKEKKLEEKKAAHEKKKQDKQVENERKARAAVRENERKKWGFVGQWCPRCRRDEIQMREIVYGKDDTKWPQELPEHCITPECEELDIKLLSNEERRKQLQSKVEDMKQDKVRKAMARDRWNRWKSTQQFNRVGAGETDYVMWDKWLPSDDEEDELPPAPPPDTAEFRAMEKDIEERAKNKSERQRKGEKLKEQGNEAMSEGKFMKAFKKYTEGIENDKSGLRLLTNRALACLKLKNRKIKIEKLGEEVEVESYQQCIDDCQKVLDICEYLHNNEGPGVKPARIKACMRQAAAHHGLEKLEEAVEDIKKGLDEIKDLSAPDRKELTELRDKYLSDIQERERVKALREMAGIGSQESESVPGTEQKLDTKTADELASETETKIGESDSKTGSPDSNKGNGHLKEDDTQDTTGGVSLEAGTAEQPKETDAAEKQLPKYEELHTSSETTPAKHDEQSHEAPGKQQKSKIPPAAAPASKLPKSQMRKIAIVEDDDDDEEESVKPAARQPQKASSKPDAPPAKEEMEEFAQKMAGLVANPEVMKAMQDPKMQKLFAEMSQKPGGMTDEELLQKHGHDEELLSLYQSISKAFEAPAGGKKEPKIQPEKPRVKVESKQQTAAQAAAAAMGPSPLTGLDSDTMKRLREDQDLQNALRDPKMSEKFKQMLSNPASIDKLMDDPDFAKLEDKLRGIMDQASPSSSTSSQPGLPKQKTKEERLKQAVTVLDGAKKALATTDRQSKDSAAAEASKHLGQLPELLQDEDVCALFRAQQGIETLCDVLVRLGGDTAKPTLLSLQLLAMEERSSTPLLTHKGGKTLVQVLAWAQGIERNADARIPALGVIEAALQHDELRKRIVGKVWSFTPAGSEQAHRVSVIGAANTIIVGPNAMDQDMAAVSPALGILTNAMYDDSGKNQVEAMDDHGKELFQKALEFASSSAVVRRKALRLLLNASSRQSLRDTICSMRAVEKIAGALSAEVSSAEKAVWNSQQPEVLEAALGVAMNLGLAEETSEHFCKHDVLLLLKTVIMKCKSQGCVLRAASTVARIVKLSTTAQRALEVGLLDVVLERLRRDAVRAQSEDDGTLDTLDAFVRSIALSMKGSDAAIEAVMQDLNNAKSLVKLLSCRKEGVVGNAAFALQLIGNKKEHLAALGAAGAVPGLLAVVHHKRGAPQKNAALALSRVVKREENMAALKAMHGLEILNAYMRF